MPNVRAALTGDVGLGEPFGDHVAAGYLAILVAPMNLVRH